MTEIKTFFWVNWAYKYTLPFKSLGSVRFKQKEEINAINSESKDIYHIYVTNCFYFK